MGDKTFGGLALKEWVLTLAVILVSVVVLGTVFFPVFRDGSEIRKEVNAVGNFETEVIRCHEVKGDRCVSLESSLGGTKLMRDAAFVKIESDSGESSWELVNTDGSSVAISAASLNAYLGVSPESSNGETLEDLREKKDTLYSEEADRLERMNDAGD